MKRGRLKSIGSEFFPHFCLGEDPVAGRPRAVPTFFRIANFENKLQLGNSITRILPLKTNNITTQPPATMLYYNHEGALYTEPNK